MLPWKQAYKRWRSDLTLNIQLYVRFNGGAAFVKFSRSYFTLRFSSCCRSYSVLKKTPLKRIRVGTFDPSTRFQSDNHPDVCPEISKLISAASSCLIPLAVSANTHLSDLLDLGASLPDERAALAGRDDQPQGDRRLTGHRAVSYQRCQVLRERRRETWCGYTDSTSSIWLKSFWQQSEVITSLTSKKEMYTKWPAPSVSSVSGSISQSEWMNANFFQTWKQNKTNNRIERKVRDRVNSINEHRHVWKGEGTLV